MLPRKFVHKWGTLQLAARGGRVLQRGTFSLIHTSSNAIGKNSFVYRIFFSRIPPQDPLIASLSFGDLRHFVLKEKPHLCGNSSPKSYRFTLTHGSLVVMSGKTLKNYEVSFVELTDKTHTFQHIMLETKELVGPRVHLTFRCAPIKSSTNTSPNTTINATSPQKPFTQNGRSSPAKRNSYSTIPLSNIGMN